MKKSKIPKPRHDIYTCQSGVRSHAGTDVQYPGAVVTSRRYTDPNRPSEVPRGARDNLYTVLEGAWAHCKTL